MQANRWKHVRTYILQNLRACVGLRAVDEEAVPVSAPVTSRLFMLPVATRWWVLSDNTFWHARWDNFQQQRPLLQWLELKTKHPSPNLSRMKR